MVSQVRAPRGIDVSKPHPARVYDCWLGGKDNYGPDRAVADQTVALAPETLCSVRDNRGFLRRAVRFLAGEAGIGQFIDIGSGLPTMDNTHEVAQRAAPGARVVYVDNDPVVVAHGAALLATDDLTGVIRADLRDPRSILDHDGLLDLIDPDRPVGVLLVAVLHFLSDADDPWEVVAWLRDAMAPGSYLVVSHLTGDRDPVRGRAAVDIWERAEAPVVPALRTREQIAGFFDGLRVVEPGVVPISEWRPGTAPGERRFWLYGGVGRTPAQAVAVQRPAAMAAGSAGGVPVSTGAESLGRATSGERARLQPGRVPVSRSGGVPAGVPTQDTDLAGWHVEAGAGRRSATGRGSVSRSGARRRLGRA